MTAIAVQRAPEPLARGTAACIGAFDGFHLGHQALFARARRESSHVAVVTFEPHPLVVVAPERAPRLLQSPEQRVRVAEALGLDVIVLLPFSRELAVLSPEAFVTRYLAHGLRPERVVVGEDFRFGAGRSGTAEGLGRLLAPHGIGLVVVPPIPIPTEGSRGPLGAEEHPAVPGKLGSTEVRRALDVGDVARAGSMLGRWHAVAGRVAAGHKRGRALGFPTANLGLTGGYLPPHGIYASVLVVWDPSSPDHGCVWPSVTSLGRNPTFETGDAVQLETYVLDRDLGDRLYGVEVEVSFVARLRDELAFDGPAALVRQIERDVAEARAIVDDAALRFTAAPGRRIAFGADP